VSKTASVATPPATPSASIISAKRFLSEVEVEASYGIPHRTLQNWRVLGRGPLYRKFGKAVKYDVADLEAWIQALPTGGAGVPSCAVGER
jgi:hypothetical protein